MKASFEKVWQQIFTSPVHLDSALSKLQPRQKSVVAQLMQRILLRPVSTAQLAGIGLRPGEPWSLRDTEGGLARWTVSTKLAEALHSIWSSQGGLPNEPALEEDFPPEMIQALAEDWGEEVKNDLISVLSQEPPLSLRAARALDTQALIQDLKPLGIRVVKSSLAPQGVVLERYAKVMGSSLYADGLFEIQDEGSQVMAAFALWPELYGPLLSEKPGTFKGKAIPLPAVSSTPKNVVDACAGAGGKVLAMADYAGARGRFFAYDISEKKLQALRRRATRAKLNCIQAVAVKENQESELVAKFKGKADRVLVDAPCTGWGVLRRNPDIKWRQSLEAVFRMSNVQARLLKAYAEGVAPGGTLVFGLCTFRKAETTQVVEEVLKDLPDFTKGPGGFLGPGPCDGFFMQSFLRKS